MIKLDIQPITTEAYQVLTKDAKVLEQDATAPKVLMLADGKFLKLFRRKRWFSSELVYPYVMRFADNALILQKLAIATPDILHLYRFSLAGLDFTAVHYTPLAGKTLRQVMLEVDQQQQQHFIKLFGQLLATLHQQGVYFRSIHLGNVLVLPDNTLGLIDFADMRKQAAALAQSKRTRNLKHMQRYKEDAKWLFNDYFTEFYKGYESLAGTKDSLFLINQGQQDGNTRC